MLHPDKEPRYVGKEANEVQALGDEVHAVGRCPGGERVKGLVKGHPAHDLEAKVVEPLAGIEGLAPAGFDPV